MTTEEKINRLNDIYMNALSTEADSAFLRQALFEDDYCLRSKAFYVAERCCDDEVRNAVFEVLLNDEREWQLRALSVLYRHPTAAALPYLKDCLFQREKPLLIRGALLTLAETAGEAGVGLLGDFLLSPFSGYLKDDFLSHCLVTVIDRTENGAALWEAMEKERPALSSCREVLNKKGQENELLMVYPYPDYLSRMAEKQGLTPKEWKRVSFFPRKKSAGKKVVD